MRLARNIAVLCVGMLAVAHSPAVAGIAGAPEGSVIQTCFVGNAVTAHPADVAFIKQNLALVENYGHVRYVYFGTNGRCPDPTETADKQYAVNQGDLRIGVPNTLDYDGVTPITGLALGKGCADPGTQGWWANFPDNRDKPEFRACRLNAYLRQGMALNKILHEIGHSLGMIHEHERNDTPKDTDPAVAICYKDVKYFGKGVGPGNGVVFATPYDRMSVMHYEINFTIDPTNVPATSSCNLGNDNGTNGFSTMDMLTLRILYPHDAKVAEYVGVTTIRAGQTLVLRNQWGDAGAIVDQVVRNPKWLISTPFGTTVTVNSANLSQILASPGKYHIVYAFDDGFGRHFSNAVDARVLTPANYTAEAAAVAAVVQLN